MIAKSIANLAICQVLFKETQEHLTVSYSNLLILFFGMPYFEFLLPFTTSFIITIMSEVRHFGLLGFF